MGILRVKLKTGHFEAIISYVVYTNEEDAVIHTFYQLIISLPVENHLNMELPKQEIISFTTAFTFLSLMNVVPMFIVDISIGWVELPLPLDDSLNQQLVEFIMCVV